MEGTEVPCKPTTLTVSAWLELFQSRSSDINSALESIYGVPTRDNEQETKLRTGILERRVERYITTLTLFAKEFPELSDKEVAIVRCPARVNMRGMHIDSHGGACNALAIPLETFVIVYPSSIDPARPHLLSIKNANSSFEELCFDLAEHPALPKGWGKYVIGSLDVLKEHYHKEGSLKEGFACNGLTALISSDIPTGSGLSSSHSLVMAFIFSILLSNATLPPIPPIALIELARAAEGKAGAVTGLADQGAMRFAKEGKVLSTCFYQNDHSAIQPQWAPWPSAHALVIAESLKKRDLGGKEAASYAVPRFAYSIGLGLLKEIMLKAGYPSNFVETVDRLSRLSDEHFAAYEGSISVYKLLKAIPEWVTISDLIETYPNLKNVVTIAEQNYLSKLPLEKQPKRLALRGPLLFGISECARARTFFKLLHAAHDKGQEGNETERTQILKQAGELMDIGHKGDSDPYAAQHPISDEYLDDLIARLTNNKEDAEAQLERQAGAFSGSIAELDEMQHILMEGGALGASLTGAGMGGCVVALMPLDNMEKAKAAITERYYLAPHSHFPTDLPVDPTQHIHSAFPIAGVGYLTLHK